MADEARRLYGDFNVDVDHGRDWWMQQAVLERDALNRERARASQALAVGAWGGR
jgi:hypothetical protein